MCVSIYPNRAFQPLRPVFRKSGVYNPILQNLTVIKDTPRPTLIALLTILRLASNTETTNLSFDQVSKQSSPISPAWDEFVN